MLIVGDAGPAVHMIIQHRNGCQSIMDTSIAIPCPKWPSVAEEWTTRFRISSWPSKTLVDSAVRHGCHVVPKSHPNTQTNLDWRISFSFAEKLLIGDLNEAQRLAYRIFKCIWRQFLKHPHKPGVQSYHLKTILLWSCERIPKTEWTEETLSERIHDLLKSLAYCLLNHALPNYFVSECNLFDHIDEDVLFKSLVRTHIAITNSKLLLHVGIAVLPEEQSRTQLPGQTVWKILNCFYIKICCGIFKHKDMKELTFENLQSTIKETLTEAFDVGFDGTEELSSVKQGA